MGQTNDNTQVENFNKLSAVETECLSIVSEEAGEIVQAIGKTLRHGMRCSVINDSGAQVFYDNIADVVQEFADISAAMSVCLYNGVVKIDGHAIKEMENRKLERMRTRLHHAKLPPLE